MSDHVLVASDDNAPSTISPSPSPSSGPPPNTSRCFVCLVDEPDDNLPADWSRPCSCSLEGHQECLLAWVADLEARVKDIKCPVCQSPIILTEPYDAVLHLSTFLDRQFTTWSPRILLAFVVSGTLFSSSIYGAKAISMFAGPEATLAFLTKTEETSLFRRLRPRSYQSPLNILHLSILPVIPAALLLNRLHIGDIVTFPASLVVCLLYPSSSSSTHRISI